VKSNAVGRATGTTRMRRRRGPRRTLPAARKKVDTTLPKACPSPLLPTAGLPPQAEDVFLEQPPTVASRYANQLWENPAALPIINFAIFTIAAIFSNDAMSP
jgi:hypothetical protein